MKNYTDLTGLYSLSKTLRFELKPIGKTLDHIKQKGLITKDSQMADEYKQVKDIIDRYHKTFIKKCLENLSLKLTSDGRNDSLEDYVRIASKTGRNEIEEAEFALIKSNLRKQIVEAFKKDDSYNDLFKKELIQQRLPVFIAEEDDRQMVDNFSKFTTYFSGFQKNRENMYSGEEKSGAIGYRLIHENLPMFLDNIKSFQKIANSEAAQYFIDIDINPFFKSFNAEPNIERLSEIFQLDYFTKTLTQERIDIYNNIIGCINECVNQYNQQHKDSRLPLLKPLYKMILSDKVAVSWLPEEFTSDGDMLNAINQAIESLKEPLTGGDAGSLKYLLTHMDTFDTERIYIANDLGLTNISQQIFGRYDVYTNVIKDKLRSEIQPSAKERREPELFEERINKLFKSAKSFSINYLNSLVTEGTIQSYYSGLGAYDRETVQNTDIFTQIEMCQIAATDILAGKRENLNQNEFDIKVIKDLLDSYKSLQHFVKPLLGSGDESDKDNEFDAHLRAVWSALDIITPLYDKVRNWLTRKPYSEEKIKLNFENAQLLGGWDVNKETDCTSILLRKGKNYYLAIMDKSANHTFDLDELPHDGDCYEKIDYKQIALPMGLGAFVRKCSGTAMQYGWKCPANCQNTEGKIIIKDKEAENVLPELIDCYKDFLNMYEKDGFAYRDYNFKFRDSNCYEKLSQFFAEVPTQGYKIAFRDVSVSFIDSLVNDGKIYLFQIWNKDFSDYSKGAPNMHTMYWRMLFDKQNLEDVVYKLNGQAEVFYRKQSLDLGKTTIHHANKPIANKNSQGEKKTSTFDYDIIKNRRYTVDKFHFHVPITINFKSAGSDNINSAVQQIIRDNNIMHIIGIDRGERHLLYLSLIDLKGSIVKQMSLNDIVNEYNGNRYVTKYKDMLTEREGDRTEARRNWQKIENIKDLKHGYLSQVVHVIAKMMVEYQAIVVLEDLNIGFMRGRQKIERSVYEQFEKMLIDKLNYFVDKQKKADEAGGLLHALQLTSKFESFKKINKQSGCLFYIPAWNTSKIDPVTGFVNLFDTRYENMDKARSFFYKFDSIKYNEDKDWFEFAFDYDNFTEKAKGTRTNWTLCSHGTRIRTFPNPQKLNRWDNEEINLTGEFKKVFTDVGIDINGNLKASICKLTDKKYLEQLMGLMKLMLQMRNSIANSEVDYLISPVADEKGNFYDSRTCSETLPKDADANGAYNIARKGLWALLNIQHTQDGQKPNLSINNKEWLQFVQQKPYLND